MAASIIPFISVTIFLSFTQNELRIICSCKFSSFLWLIFFPTIFKNAISGFHKTNKNIWNAIKWYTGMLILARAFSWCTLFAITSITTYRKKFFFLYWTAYVSIVKKFLKTCGETLEYRSFWSMEKFAKDFRKPGRNFAES